MPIRIDAMLRTLLLLIATSCLTACGGDGVRQRLFPPSASIQELAVQPDGSWKLKVRVQNFSNVAMTVVRVEANLKIGAAPAGKIELQPAVAVPPESVEVFESTLMPQSAAANLVMAAAAKRLGGQVAYSLAGRIDSSEPDARKDDFEFKSQLSSVPGLERVLR
jgi:hypothetical protein